MLHNINTAVNKKKTEQPQREANHKEIFQEKIKAASTGKCETVFSQHPSLLPQKHTLGQMVALDRLKQT